MSSLPETSNLSKFDTISDARLDVLEAAVATVLHVDAKMQKTADFDETTVMLFKRANLKFKCAMESNSTSYHRWSASLHGCWTKPGLYIFSAMRTARQYSPKMHDVSKVSIQDSAPLIGKVSLLVHLGDPHVPVPLILGTKSHWRYWMVHHSSTYSSNGYFRWNAKFFIAGLVQSLLSRNTQHRRSHWLYDRSIRKLNAIQTVCWKAKS